MPLLTVICPPTPVTATVLSDVPLKANKPVPVVPTKFCKTVERLIVGLPVVPSGLAIDTPDPLEAICTLVKVVLFVLT